MLLVSQLSSLGFSDADLTLIFQGNAQDKHLDIKSHRETRD